MQPATKGQRTLRPVLFRENGRAGKEEMVHTEAEEAKGTPTQDRHPMGASYFDVLAKGLANGTLSRRRALKLLGASFVSTLLLPLVPGVAMAAPTCPSSGPGCSAFCRHTGGFTCVCLKLANGNSKCVFPVCGRTCKKNSDCPSGSVCSTTAKKCCNSSKPVCVPKCNTSTSGAAETTTQSGTSNAGNGAWDFNAS